jgi:diketogulonate reductase-like aldo/keto reductase
MTRAIGVSNWNEEHLAALAEDGATVVPHVNQIEISPYTQYTDTLDYCKSNNIVVEAYSPLGSTAGNVLRDPTVLKLAEKYGKNPGQIVLRWLVQQRFVVLPRSSSQTRMASNMEVFDIVLSEEDMKSLSALNKGKSLTNASPYDIL